ncbi:hypothetical protein SAMN05444360_102251 [Chryseobacterium carnipullorum]|uniref:hypothetical protein n=1 Tax=Chryseobacterium carnipullorum TaxID=1124835 RepID=UPI000914A6D1|nr:hypothetical protein [Chryseobacterium carnipullorum]SHL54167.1 hypothetical protein SAMN05444360_102251 [Chryseobacterium carnipullorum]
MKNKTFYLFLLLCFSARIFSQVGINTTSPNPKSALDVISKNNNTGVLIPRLTTVERDAIGAASTEDGLTIYNTDEKCYNYYQSTNTAWLSLCGTYQKAVYTTDCTNIKVFGTYTQGTSLNTSNYITMPITVTKAGTYNIVAKTTNGYYFEKSGVFPNTGTFTITLDGSGAPSTGPQTNTLSFVYDGLTDTACTTKTVSVLGSQVSYGINCNGAVVNGTYNKGVQLVYDDNTVTITLSNVDTSGTVSINSSTNNGVNFTTTESINPSSTNITLHGVGTPTSAGTYTYTFTTNGANPQTCTFSVTFETNLGTFANPANRCLEIYNDGKRTDGEYFIKGSGSDVVKTYCDMTNGGYTLIQSYSEKALLTDNDNDLRNNQNLNWNGNKNYTAAVGASGIVTYRNFLLPLVVRQQVRSNTTGNLYRVRIVEDAVNLNTNGDAWAKNNYAVFDLSTAGSNDFIGNVWTSTQVKITSKLFGKNYNTTGVTSGNYVTFDGQSWNYAETYNIGNAKVISHQSNPPNYAFTYTNTNGSTTSSNLVGLDDIWGPYSDSTFNHHIGKCRPTLNGTTGIGDDYQGVVECNGGLNVIYRTPHSFNGGEGRYVQWFVK